MLSIIHQNLSKVKNFFHFLLYFSVLAFQKFLTPVCRELIQCITSSSVCQELFSSFFEVFRSGLTSVVAPSRERSAILPDSSPFVNSFFSFFSSFFIPTTTCANITPNPQNRGSLNFPYAKERTPDGVRSRFLCNCSVIRRPRSGRSLRRYACKRRQTRRCCPRHGKQRSCAPADSSEGWPPHGSWASC